MNQPGSGLLNHNRARSRRRIAEFKLRRLEIAAALSQIRRETEEGLKQFTVGVVDPDRYYKYCPREMLEGCIRAGVCMDREHCEAVRYAKGRK